MALSGPSHQPLLDARWWSSTFIASRATPSTLHACAHRTNQPSFFQANILPHHNPPHICKYQPSHALALMAEGKIDPVCRHVSRASEEGAQGWGGEVSTIWWVWRRGGGGGGGGRLTRLWCWFARLWRHLLASRYGTLRPSVVLNVFWLCQQGGGGGGGWRYRGTREGEPGGQGGSAPRRHASGLICTP